MNSIFHFNQINRKKIIGPDSSPKMDRPLGGLFMSVCFRHHISKALNKGASGRSQFVRGYDPGPASSDEPEERHRVKVSKPQVRVRYDYTKGPIGKGLVRLSIPIFFELIAWNIDSILELYWVGRLGANALAAMSLGFMAQSFVRAVGMGIRTAGQALLAQRVGAGDNEGASLIAAQTLLLQIISFGPIMIVGFWLTPWILRLLTSDPVIADLGTQYLRAGFAMLIFIDGIFTCAAIFRGAGEPRFSLIGMAINSIAVLIAIPVLIFGVGPVPAFGIGGATLGLGVGRSAGVAVMIGFLFSGKSRIHLRPAHFKPQTEYLIRIASLGWPVSGQNFFERGANLLLVGLISPYGGVALAAWGVANRLSQMGRMPGFAIQGATRTLVGQNVGATQPDRAQRAAWTAIGTVVVILGITTSALFIWAEPVISFFGLQGEEAPAGVICLRILCLGIGFEATRRVISGIFEGAAMTKPPMIMEAIVRWGVLVPLAYLVSSVLTLPATGIWWTVAGSQVLGGVALFLWFVTGWTRRMKALG
jgi:putative MATE family efflux protein